MTMETKEERRLRIQQKSKKQFLIFAFLACAIGFYIALFAGNSFLEAAAERAVQEE